MIGGGVVTGRDRHGRRPAVAGDGARPRRSRVGRPTPPDARSAGRPDDAAAPPRRGRRRRWPRSAPPFARRRRLAPSASARRRWSLGVGVRRRPPSSVDRAAARRRDVEAAMPDAVELLVLCIHAGCSPHQAVEQLAARAPPSAAAGVRRRRPAGSTAGRSLADALGELPTLLGPPGRDAGLGHRQRRPRRPAAGAGARSAGRRGPGHPASPRRGRGPSPAGAPDVPARRVHAALVRAARHRAGRARRPLDAAGHRALSVPATARPPRSPP